MTPSAKRHSITRAAAELDEAETRLHQCLVRVFGRLPTDAELAYWAERLDEPGLTPRGFLDALSASAPYVAHVQAGTKAPPGHYLSPVVDPATVGEYVAMNRAAGLEGLRGIEFPLAEMAAFWRENADFIAATPFAEAADGVHRYAYTAGPYRYGDGVVLRAMIHHYRPRRIIEIGSGYSTACMLDTIEHLGLAETRLTCIEPNPTRLLRVMRGDDHERTELLRTQAQQVPLEVFAKLECHDVLFIDSSHVLKTGSDVHYALFHILPSLAPGVLVHFHDCRFPLEYSDRQIFVKNYSWNEVYGVRALLMYSTRFRVLFQGSLFAQTYPDLAEISPPFMTNPGSALWIKVT